MRIGMQGFGKTLAGSAAFHAILFALAFFVFGTEQGRVFIAPVYTVDLVPGPKAQAPKPDTAPAAKKEPAPVAKEAPAEPEPAQKTPVSKSAPTVKIKEKPASIDEAVKALSDKVQRRKDEEALTSSIEDIKKRVEAKKEASERLSQLREELSTREQKQAPAPEAAKKPSAQATTAARTPSAGGRIESKYPAYYGIIRDRVQQNWIYPPGTKDSRASVIISLKIARNGKILDASVEKSSGNTVFDESLLSAVWKASPFPPLPAEFEGNYLETGLRFCPGCQQ